MFCILTLHLSRYRFSPQPEIDAGYDNQSNQNNHAPLSETWCGGRFAKINNYERILSGQFDPEFPSATVCSAVERVDMGLISGNDKVRQKCSRTDIILNRKGGVSVILYFENFFLTFVRQ